jgi:hypothetical protein
MDGLAQIVDYYLWNADFWTGVLVAFVAMWTITHLAGWFVKRWNRMRQAWQPVRRPKIPMEEGPSPVQELSGCVGRALVLALALAIVVMVLWILFA